MEKSLNKTRIGFVGAGSMAGAIVKGLTANKGSDNGLSFEITVINKSNRLRLDSLCTSYGVNSAKGYQQLVAASELILLAVKPNQMTEVLENISPLVTEEHLVISVAAGISIKSIESFLKHGVPVIRAMPNTPAQVGEGVSVLSAGARVNPHHKMQAESVFSSVGKVFWLEESLMDAVTALSGSGPAYFYQLAQDMAETAVQMGLEKDLSEELSKQTLIGAGYLLKSSGLTLFRLIEQIASPNGTTEAALRVLDSNRLGRLIETAMGEALRRSEEISEAYFDESMRKDLSITGAKRVVVKIGSSTITDEAGTFNELFLKNIALQVSSLMSEGRQVVIVSSGAMAAGKGRMGNGRKGSMTDKQVLAAVGQGLLMKSYETVFEGLGLTVGQVLLTKDDLSNPKRSSLCQNTLDAMLERQIIPVINENDTVAVEEIRFGDNDSLSARVAGLIDADLLVLLTDTEGFYDKDPRLNQSAKLIPTVKSIDDSILSMAGDTHNSGVATGGMTTKVWAASIAGKFGIPTVIARGSTPKVLQLILKGNLVGTLFMGGKSKKNLETQSD